MTSGAPVAILVNGPSSSGKTMLCRGLDYDASIRTDQQSTAESVDTIIAALHAATAAG